MDNFIRNATVVRWVDGDTVILDVDLGYHMRTKQYFRLLGVDTPELRSKWPKQRRLAREATLFCETEIPVGSTVGVKSSKSGKFGRWLAEIYYGDDPVRNIAKELIYAGLGKEI